jgi:hypothetical protein
VLRRGGELGWGVGCSSGGERWDGEEEGEIEEESVGRVGMYWLLPMESPTDTFRRYTRWWVHRWMFHVTVRRSLFESLDHSVGKIVWKKYTSSHHCNFSKNYIICRWYGWYILTELETELFQLVKITNEKIQSVIPLVFTNFLVVGWIFICLNKPSVLTCAQMNYYGKDSCRCPDRIQFLSWKADGCTTTSVW